MSAARYRCLTAAETAALAPRELDKYRAERAAFDREAGHVAHLAEHGWINVAEAGKPESRFYLRRVRP